MRGAGNDALYGGMPTGRAKRWSDKFLQYNGLPAWNRAMPISATRAAERVIDLYKTECVDTNDKAAVALSCGTWRK